MKNKLLSFFVIITFTLCSYAQSNNSSRNDPFIKTGISGLLNISISPYYEYVDSNNNIITNLVLSYKLISGALGYSYNIFVINDNRSISLDLFGEISLGINLGNYQSGLISCEIPVYFQYNMGCRSTYDAHSKFGQSLGIGPAIKYNGTRFKDSYFPNNANVKSNQLFLMPSLIYSIKWWDKNSIIREISINGGYFKNRFIYRKNPGQFNPFYFNIRYFWYL